MATKKLRSQVMENLHHLLWSAVTLGISVYAGIQVFLNGPGNRSEPGKSLRGLVQRLLYWLEDNGYAHIVVGILLVTFGLTALISLALTIHHAGYLTRKRSILGRSIREQASPHEMFEDLVQAVDSDLAMEAKEFGTELLAGTQWLLSDQAMRIAKVERLYMGGRKKRKHILLAADGKGNVMETVFAREQDRDEAVRYLRGRIPELYVGDIKELK